MNCAECGPEEFYSSSLHSNPISLSTAVASVFPYPSSLISQAGSEIGGLKGSKDGGIFE